MATNVTDTLEAIQNKMTSIEKSSQPTTVREIALAVRMLAEIVATQADQRAFEIDRARR